MADRNRRKTTSRASSSSSMRKSSVVVKSDVDSHKNMSERQKSRKRKQMRYNRRQRMILIGGAVIILILACIIGFATRRNGSEILVNGESVGIVNTRSVTQEDIVNSVSAMLAEQIGTKVQIMDEIEVKGMHVSKNTQTLTTESLLANLRDSVAYNIEAYAIAVNGDVVATLKNKEEADQTLQYLNDMYTPENAENVSISYKEDVQIISQYTNTDSIMSLEDAQNKIAIGETVTGTHTVASGDTAYSIALNYGMSLSELYDLNPELGNSSNIYVGQQLTVRMNKPYITVEATVTVTERETAEKEVQYQYDSTKSSSYKKIIQQGTNGVTEITKEQHYINGQFENEEVISSKVVTQPVTEIVSIGTN